MMNTKNELLNGPATAGHEQQPRPIAPGSSLQDTDMAAHPRGLPKNHAELVLVLGTISLFMCGPLGVAAWILGSSDLKKIQRGEMSPVKIGILRFGRSLAKIGTVIFVLSIALAAFLFHRGFTTFGDILKTEALPPDQIVFAGDWAGNRGTVIRIRPDGSADFKSRRSSMTGGRVNIQGDSLTIGLMGLTSTWHVDKRPYLEDGEWNMVLDGEIFRRKAEGHLVRLFGGDRAFPGNVEADQWIRRDSRHSRTPHESDLMGSGCGCLMV